MSETANLLFEADTLFDRWGRRTAERLRNLETVKQKVACIQDELVELLRTRQDRSSVVEFCVRALNVNAEIRSRKLGDIFRSRFLVFPGVILVPVGRVSHQSSSILLAHPFLISGPPTAASARHLAVSSENSGGS